VKEARSCCSDTGWKIVPRTSSHHAERSVTDGPELHSRYDQVLLTTGP